MQKFYEVQIKGKGGHASMPHKANNPILIAAELVLQLCAMPEAAFENQTNSCVRVLGFDAGEKGNIIPEQARVRIGICAEEEELFGRIQSKYFQFSKKIAEAYDAEAVIYEI